jgi:hypothetical protein
MGLGLFQPSVRPILPGHAPAVASGEIKCGPSDRSDKQSLRISGQFALMPPITHERILHHIFRIGE